MLAFSRAPPRPMYCTRPGRAHPEQDHSHARPLHHLGSYHPRHRRRCRRRGLPSPRHRSLRVVEPSRRRGTRLEHITQEPEVFVTRPPQCLAVAAGSYQRGVQDKHEHGVPLHGAVRTGAGS